MKLQRLAIQLLGSDLTSSIESPALRHPIRLMVLLAGVFTALDVLTYSTYYMLCLLKLALFFGKRKAILQLIRAIGDLGINANPEEAYISDMWARYEQKTMAIYFSVLLFGFAVLWLLPLLHMLVIYLLKSKIVLVFITARVIPYETESLLVYAFYHFIAFLLLVFLTCLPIVIEGSFIWCVYKIYAYSKILYVRIMAAGRRANSHRNEPKEKFIKEFHAVIYYHQQITEMIRSIDPVYREIIFVQFLFSSLNLCCFTLMLTMPSDISYKIFIVLCISAMLIQPMVYCFGGQLIQNGNNAVSSQIYVLLPWEDLNVREMRSILLALTFMQRRIRITGYFFVLNNELFATVLKSASSFLAFLRAINSENA